MIQNFGGRKFWRIWQIERDSPKFSCPNFPLKILATMRRVNGVKAGS